jgi:curli production assembly/transport component CsgG
MKHTIIALAILSLSGCAITHSERAAEEKPVVTTSMLAKEFNTIPAPSTGKPVSVAVYSFTDKTGQRRPQANIASLSTAVTQGSETFLIQALQNVGQGQWFEVVERVGLDNLTKERLIIRQMREAYEGGNAKPLMPMQFAGMIIEGGIIGYDSSTKSGGVGARWLGIGAQTQYSEDIVTVSLRAISVNTGKVLTTVTVQKTILSSSDSISALKFFDVGTKAFEGEIGLTINEPGTYAVKAAIEGAVVELIKEGQRKGLWDFKKEEKNELVQTQTSRENTTKAAAAPLQPASGADNGRSETSSPRPEAPKQEVVAPVTTKAVELPKTAYFTVLAYVYKDKDEKSQRTWQLPKGTEVISTPPVQGWSTVTTKDGKKGFVREGVLTFNKP